eukprot:TRINITY_DN9663_c0_g1_i2.p1 TRINITY_DN9663_c0_g1~~TRINITY_DN9663_c0_g1_i2.p1  ORF type:complete len:584 (-),score=174.83 TRINITY_DN9663_c0_g1_i2:92-1843(-)
MELSVLVLLSIVAIVLGLKEEYSFSKPVYDDTNYLSLNIDNEKYIAKERWVGDSFMAVKSGDVLKTINGVEVIHQKTAARLAQKIISTFGTRNIVIPIMEIAENEDESENIVRGFYKIEYIPMEDVEKLTFGSDDVVRGIEIRNEKQIAESERRKAEVARKREEVLRQQREEEERRLEEIRRQYDDYTVTFEEKTSLGIQVDMQKEGEETIIMSVDPASVAGQTRLKAGDQILAVNGVDVTSSRKMAVRSVATAEWPLSFLIKPEQPELVINKVQLPIALEITEPKMIAGQYNVESATFAMAVENCELEMGNAFDLGIATENGFMGCLPMNDCSDSLMVGRGTCTFFDKMNRAKECGSKLLILVNNNGEGTTLPDIGEGQKAPKIPVLVMDYDNGKLLQLASRFADIKATIVYKEEEEEEKEEVVEVVAAPTPPGRRRYQAPVIQNGSIMSESTAHARTLDLKILGAMFGAKWKSETVRVVMANPPEACEPLKPNPDYEGAVILTIRGVCPFGDKAINAQAAKGKGVLISTSGNLFPAPAPPDQAAQIHIPVAVTNQEIEQFIGDVGFEGVIVAKINIPKKKK